MHLKTYHCMCFCEIMLYFSEVTCKIFEVENAKLNVTSATVEFDKSVLITCNEGSEFDHNKTTMETKCGADQAWDPAPGKCESEGL